MDARHRTRDARILRWKTSTSALCWTGTTTWSVLESASRRSSPSPPRCRRCRRTVFWGRGWFSPSVILQYRSVFSSWYFPGLLRYKAGYTTFRYADCSTNALYFRANEPRTPPFHRVITRDPQSTVPTRWPHAHPAGAEPLSPGETS